MWQRIFIVCFWIYMGWNTFLQKKKQRCSRPSPIFYLKLQKNIPFFLFKFTLRILFFISGNKKYSVGRLVSTHPLIWVIYYHWIAVHILQRSNNTLQSVRFSSARFKRTGRLNAWVCPQGWIVVWTKAGEVCVGGMYSTF